MIINIYAIFKVYLYNFLMFTFVNYFTNVKYRQDFHISVLVV